MKTKLVGLFIAICLPVLALGQDAESSFHVASSQYIHGKMKEAKTTVADALKRYPTDKKLNELKNLIKEEDQKEKQNQNQQDNQDQQKQQQQQKEQQKKEQQKKEQEQKDQQQKEDEKKNQEKKDPSKEQKEKQEQDQKDEQKKDQNNLDRKKLEEMKISEEKARMILEAMKNQEKQYLQQNKRKATKSRDRNKPDW